MVVIDTTEFKSASRSANRTLTDRRRPGRSYYRNAHLIPLLRGHPVTEATTADTVAAPPPSLDDTRDDDGLGASRGILNAMLIGVAMWAAIVFTIVHFW